MSCLAVSGRGICNDWNSDLSVSHPGCWTLCHQAVSVAEEANTKQLLNVSSGHSLVILPMTTVRHHYSQMLVKTLCDFDRFCYLTKWVVWWFLINDSIMETSKKINKYATLVGELFSSQELSLCTKILISCVWAFHQIGNALKSKMIPYSFYSRGPQH